MCLDLGFDFQLDLVREIMPFPFDGLLIRISSTSAGKHVYLHPFFMRVIAVVGFRFHKDR